MQSRVLSLNSSKDFQPIHHLKEHTGAITYLRWSPDDSKLLSCSQDKHAKLWDTTVCLVFGLQDVVFFNLTTFDVLDWRMHKNNECPY